MILITHWFDDSTAQGGDKKNYSVGEENSNMCKDVVTRTELMQPQVENGLQEGMELQGELHHALDILIDEYENVEMPSQSNVKSTVAYVEVGEST